MSTLNILAAVAAVDDTLIIDAPSMTDDGTPAPMDIDDGQTTI